MFLEFPLNYNEHLKSQGHTLQLFTKILCGLSITILMAPLLAPDALAQTTDRRVVVEKVPTLTNIYKVSAAKTHSGLPVPRFVSLKYGRVNGRQGPSLRHPILWQYQRKGLPLVVVAEMDIWRKVRDIHGDESWVRSSSLSGTRMVLANEEVSLRKQPKDNARISAVADLNALLELEECNDKQWCKVKSDSGLKGWTHSDVLWGADPL